MSSRLKVPANIPCHICITLAICIDKPFSELFETCPILKAWVDKEEERRQ